MRAWSLDHQEECCNILEEKIRSKLENSEAEAEDVLTEKDCMGR